MLRAILSGATDTRTIVIYILAFAFTVFIVFPFSSVARAFVAYKLGDNTAKLSGRLTLNPISHIDPIGALSVLLVGFGWSKPVPINPIKFRKNMRRGIVITSLAGPVSYLLAAIVLDLIYNIIYYTAAYEMYGFIFYLLMFIRYVIVLNSSLFIFMLLPIPPFDGYTVLSMFLPERINRKILMYQRQIYLIVFVLIFSGILSTPLEWLSGKVQSGVFWLTDLPFRLIFRQ